MPHPERHRSQRRDCGRNQWLVVLRKALSFSFPSRFIPALSLIPSTTVGGYITQHLGRFPQTGEPLRILSYEARVTSTDGRRVGQIHFRKIATPENGIGDEEAED